MRKLLLALACLCAATAAFSQVVAKIGQNFTASPAGAFDPADANGAIGPNHFVEFINGQFSVYTRTGSLVTNVSDVTFWSRAGVSAPSGWNFADPRTLYDPVSQRWFISEIDFDPTGVVNTNHFCLAISASSNPTGSWQGIRFLSDPGGTDGADFDSLGLDAQGVYLSALMFDTNGFLVGPTIWSFPKADLLSAPPVTNHVTWLGELDPTTRGWALQPAVCLDGSGVGDMLGVASLGFNQVTGSPETSTTLFGSTVQNVAGPGNATLSSQFLLSVPSYTTPINPPQPDGSSNLDDGDSRLSSSMLEVGGVLFVAQGTEVNGRAAIRWYRLRGSDFTVLESGTITDPVLDLFYASVAANPSGTVVLAFNGCSSSSFINCYAVVGQTVRGVTTFGSLMLLKAGISSYQNAGTSGNSRWGDYSATTLDPTDPNRFWTIQMFPTTATDWSTQVTEILTAIPFLSIARSGANVTLSWPGTAIPFNLESTPTLAHPSWTVVTQSSSSSNGVVSVQLPASGAPQFFRLQGQ